MSKLTKKGRNISAVDSWLDTLGYYRKNVAYDETCLFRAVSEQLFNCQVYHERVRKESIAYARTHIVEFLHLIESSEKFYERLDKLQKHMLFCGSIEIDIVSRTYNHDVIIFDGVKHIIYNATKRNLPKSLFLCLMEEDHYDVIYQKQHIVTAGFCQSIVYKIFYEKVFEIVNVDDIVRNMLYDKHNLIAQSEVVNNVKRKMFDGTNINEIEEKEATEARNLPVNPSTNLIAPFPFKVAKALDPNIYRNIEYDSWGETRRELRLGEWYYGDDNFILGTKCVYNDTDTADKYECYIQEIIKDKNKCVIYLTKLAQKRTVWYSNLSPEDDAKPWPLPYRFTKNLTIASSAQPVVEKTTQKIKKRKDKKRTKSESSLSVISSAATAAAAVTCEPLENVDAYIGIPLQMHSPNDSTYLQQSHSVASETTQTEPVVQDTEVTEDTVPENRYTWESPQWYLPPTPDPFVWPQPSTAPLPNSQFNFGLKPMVASAPVTPDIVPYHDASYPFYCNYQIEPYMYSHWSAPNIELFALTPKLEERTLEDVVNQQCLQPEINASPRINQEITYEQVNNTVPNERPTLCTNLTPPSPAVELYSPVLQMAPGTPVLYTPLPEIPEMMISSPPVLYTSQVEMPYASPGPFIYPPTPPTAWYPPRVNSQGFIFPPPN